MSEMKLIQFKAVCEHNGVKVPDLVTRALATIDAARAVTREPEVRVLDLTPAQVRDYVKDVSLRTHTDGVGKSRGYSSGLRQLEEHLWAEVRELIQPDLERIVTSQRKAFDRVVAPIVTGVRRHGFTYSTTSDDVVLAGDPKGMIAWRDSREAWPAVRTIARFRATISELFEVSPTWKEAQAFGASASGARNWSVCFAAGDHWSLGDGYHIEDKPSLAGLDWFAIAQGGLRLNTPSEVRRKIVERAEKQGKFLDEPDQLEDEEPDLLQLTYPTAG